MKNSGIDEEFLRAKNLTLDGQFNFVYSLWVVSRFLIKWHIFGLLLRN